MGKDPDQETTQQQDVSKQINKLYRAAARLQCTILQSDSINYDMELSDQLQLFVRSACADAVDALDILKEMEE